MTYQQFGATLDESIANVDPFEDSSDMAWAIPRFNKTQVDWAGGVLAQETSTEEDLDRALEIINNWRSSHAFPLNTIQIGIRYRARQADPESLVAQRIKRLSSIRLKLERFRSIRLSQMQDIGGCRAVVRSVQHVRRLTDLYTKSEIRHKLDHVDDYIQKPRNSGYRGVHLIYRYLSDRSETYNGLKIEVQLRSPLQHAWATAVETVGTFTRQALKSSRGEAEWLRFFSLMGTAIANREHTNPVPDTPTSKRTLRKELTKRAKKLEVERHLVLYSHALKGFEETDTEHARYFLVELDTIKNHIKITGYKSRQLDKASDDYLT